MKRRKSQQGYALIASMGVGVVALAITSAVLLRTASSNNQVIQREQQDKLLSISESVVNQVLDAMAEATHSKNIDGADTWGAAYTAYELANTLLTDSDGLEGYDFMSTSANTSGSGVRFTRLSNHSFPASSQSFYNSLQTNPEHSLSFWNAFSSTASNSSTSLNLGGSFAVSGFSFEQMHQEAFSTYAVEKENITAEVRVSIVPLATDKSGKSDVDLHSSTSKFAGFVNHNDVYKIRVETFWPSISSHKYRKRVDVIVNRPAEIKTATDPLPKSALWAGKGANLGNVDTSSGPCAGASCVDTTLDGDVHVNDGDLIIGSNGYIQGKATATGTVTVKNTDIPSTEYSAPEPTGRDSSDVVSGVRDEHESRSEVPALELPEFDTSTDSIDDTPCVDRNTDGDSSTVQYKDCVVNGDLNIGSHDKIVFEGSVHIEGDLDNKGAMRCGGTVECRIVIDGTSDSGGNSSTNFYSENESLFIVRGIGAAPGTTCLDIGGNPDASGENGTLYYVENPDCNTKFHGSFAFFGAIFTEGTFEGKGNASSQGIQRDSDMSAFEDYRVPDAKPKQELFPQVISWKDIR